MTLTIRRQLTSPNRANTPDRGDKLITRWGGHIGITVHGTGNPNPGADAGNQADWQQSADAAAHYVCVHGYVDDREAVQTWPFDAKGYHAGDGCEDPATDFGCYSTLGIEGCESSTVDPDRMQLNFAQLIARIHLGDPAFDWGDGHTRGKVSIDELWQHVQVSQERPPHFCPKWLLIKPNGWGQFMLQIDAAVAELQGTTPAPPSPHLPGGMTDRLAAALFGTRFDSNGTRYSFNPSGTRSKRWIEHGARSIPVGGSWIDGRWPALESVYTEGTGKGRKILQYSDGWLDDGQAPVS